MINRTVFMLWFCLMATTAQPQPPRGLLCNLLSHPEFSVITDRQPTFGWETSPSGQLAYRILVSSSAEKAAQHEGDIWDSGEQKSQQSIGILYGGQPLQPECSYRWQVSVRDGMGKWSDWSVVQQFNTGEFDRQRPWPGESRWVRIAVGGDSIWTFENRHPISYHAVAPVRSINRAGGVFFYDFGKSAFSNARFTIQTPTSGEVTVRIGEKAAGDSIDSRPGGGIIFRQYPLSLQKGTYEYEIAIPRFVPRYPHSQAMPAYMPEIIPFRYIEIVAGSTPVTVHAVEQRALYYLFDDGASAFSSDSDTLNAVYNLCKYSVKANTFNGDYAASERERMMYEADAYIHQLGTYAIDREYAVARYSLVNMIYHATWPTEWILHIPLMAWADYLNTGDTQLIAEYYDDLKPKTLLALAGDSALISTRTGGRQTPEFLASIHHTGTLRDIVDWPHGTMSTTRIGGETDNYDFCTYNTVVNAFHYRALVLMGRIADVLERKDDVEFYNRRAEKQKEAFNRYFLDRETAVYVDGIGSEHASLHANMYALAFGLVPESGRAAVVDFIKSKGMACGVYSANYLLEALYDAGEADYALQLLTSDSVRSWWNMIRVGATMTTEAWDNRYKSNNGWSHAWSSSPVHIIPRKLMGIEPLEAGYGKIRIRPQPASIRQASVKVPTIRGAVEMSFRQMPGRYFEMDVTAPGNVTAEILLPLPAAKYRLTVDGKTTRGKAEGKYVHVKPLRGGTHRYRVECLPPDGNWASFHLNHSEKQSFNYFSIPQRIVSR